MIFINTFCCTSQYVDDIKGHRSDEARLVEQLQRRVRSLMAFLS